MKPLMPWGMAQFVVMVHDDPNVGALAPEVQAKAAALYRAARNTLVDGRQG